MSLLLRPSALGVVLLLLTCTSTSAQSDGTQGYYRFPALHGETLVFSAEGDLWRVNRTGGAAQRLTTHPGQEAYPVLSPDGQWVAFAGDYEGTAELYVMPVGGGLPKRLTWDGGSGTRPVAWTAEGAVVYRTWRYGGLPVAQLATVDPETFERARVPLHQAADAAYGPDGTLVFTRLPRQGSNARWYKGGLAQNLWAFAPGTDEAVPLTADWPGTSKQPRVHDGRLYFLSDREGGMNVWSMTLDGRDLRRHTAHDDWDIQEHTLHGSTIVYRLGADLWTLDLATNETARIPITLVSDFDQRRETWDDAPLQRLSAAAVSPDGRRVALAARGEIFVAPVGKGRRVHVTRDSGVRYRTVLFDPDGEHLLAVSDRSGELEWWRLRADGTAPSERITNGPAMLRLGGDVSPDGEHIAEFDYDRRLWVTDLASGATRQIAGPMPLPVAGGLSLSWSPDSRHLSYAQPGDNLLTRVHVYDTETETTHTLTNDRYGDRDPAWDAEADWLYLLSDRTFNSSVGSPWGAYAPQPHFTEQTKIYALPLRADARFPFRRTDELTATDSSATADSSGTPDAPLRFDRLGALREVPVPAGNYSELAANAKRLFYLMSDGDKTHLIALDIEPDAEPVTLVEDVGGFSLSDDGEKLLVRKGPNLHVIAAASGAGAKLDDDSEVNLDGWRVPVDPKAEWRQIFADAWRLHRDYFYDLNLHGVDWRAVRAKFEPLVDRVGSREALADLQAQMVAELSLLHSDAGGGDTRGGTDDVLPASLGARFTRTADGFRVEHVYQADPDLPGERAPLAHPDVAVEAGDVILAVNGVSAAGAPDMGALLRGLAGQPVRLRVRSDGEERDVIAEAVSLGEEFDLRYDEWEYTRRLAVEQQSDGAIGYVHLRAMGTNDIGQWTREFYPVFDRQGLIIDVRHNNGGNIDSWILGQLLRQPWMYMKGRTGAPIWNMQLAFRGHIVVLVDERTASDGEAFAEGFRRLGLGEVIGTRTWGGEVWLTSSNQQVDGGIARAAEFGAYGAESEWLIEGVGVVPDHVVDNLPHATFSGEDAQLDAAIRHLQALIAADPRPVPSPPRYPVVRPGMGYPVELGRLLERGDER